MSEEDKYILVGKIGAVYGVHGWLKVQTYTEYGDNLLDYAPWYLCGPHGVMHETTIVEGKRHGKILLAKFAGYDAPETARALTSKTIHIKRSQLPPLKADEYYWSDLVGLTVINQKGETLGQIAYLIETGSNDVIVVKNPAEIAIPYLPGTVVLNIDLAKKEMLVDWEPL